ncbi:MAG TPA: CoA-binding protein [Armatimonadota bacterium]|jgi:hypothetical protein
MDSITQLLRSARTIAVVGLSDKADRSSYGVAEYLQAAGYRIIPVNPAIVEWKGIPAVASLQEIAEPVDIVDVFRRSDQTSPVVEGAIAIRARCVWLQQGITNEIAMNRASEAGLIAIQDRCLALEHSKRRREIGESPDGQTTGLHRAPG